MSDSAKFGKDWSDDELDAIVADYFAMLELERAGTPFVKSHRAAALMVHTGRSHRSIEFKHMNISAVLSEIGVKPIAGYTPMVNFQGAIFDAIDRYLSAHRRVLDWVPELREYQFAEPQAAFEETPPPLKPRDRKRPERLERLVRKFDPSLRDFRNRALGRAGEKLILERECNLLRSCDRPDLARKVRWVSEEDGDGAGYDIRSYDANGAEKLLEVKTTNGGATTPFFLSRNERDLSQERPDAFRICRLFDFAELPKLFHLRPPLESIVNLETETWRASFS